MVFQPCVVHVRELDVRDASQIRVNGFVGGFRGSGPVPTMGCTRIVRFGVRFGIGLGLFGDFQNGRPLGDLTVVPGVFRIR